MSESFAPKMDQNSEGGGFSPLDGGSSRSGKGEVYRGLSNTIDTAVTAWDDYIDNKITNDVQKGYDNALSPFDPVPPKNPSDTGEPSPKEVEDTQSAVERLYQAYSQGKVTDTAYYSQLVSMAKKVKSKYPGYSDRVDKIVQSVTGVRPANALRESVLSEISSANKAKVAADKQWDTFIRRDGVIGVLQHFHPDVFTNPEKYSTEEERAKVYSSVMSWKGRVTEVNLRTSELGLDKANDDRNKRVAANTRNSVIGDAVVSSINGFNVILEQAYGENAATLLGKMADPNSGFKLDVEDQESLRAKMVSTRESLRNQLMTSLLVNGEDPTELERQIDAAMAPYDSMVNAIQEGDWSLAGQYSRMAKAQKERDVYQLKKNPSIRILDAAQDISPALSEKMLNDSSEIITAVEKAIEVINLDNLNYSDMTLDEVLNQNVNSDVMNSGERKTAIKKTLSGLETQLSDPKANPDQWKVVFDKVYNGEDIFKYFSGKAQIDVYRRLTSPLITKRVMESGDEEAKKRYHRWAISQFHYMSPIRSMAKGVNYHLGDANKFFKAGVNEDGTIKLTIDEGAFMEWADGVGPLRESQTRGSMYLTMRYLTDLNEYLHTLGPIISGVGRNPVEDIPVILNETGLNLETEETSFFTNVMNWILTSGLPEGYSREETGGPAVEGLPFEEFLTKHPEWFQKQEVGKETEIPF